MSIEDNIIFCRHNQYRVRAVPFKSVCVGGGGGGGRDGSFFEGGGGGGGRGRILNYFIPWEYIWLLAGGGGVEFLIILRSSPTTLWNGTVLNSSISYYIHLALWVHWYMYSSSKYRWKHIYLSCYHSMTSSYLHIIEPWWVWLSFNQKV